MGLIVVIIKHFSFVLQQSLLIGLDWIELLHLMNCCERQIIF